MTASRLPESVLRSPHSPHLRWPQLLPFRCRIHPAHDGPPGIFSHRRKQCGQPAERNARQPGNGRPCPSTKREMFRWHRRSAPEHGRRSSVSAAAGSYSADGFLTAEAALAVLTVILMTALCTAAVRMRFLADRGTDRAGAEMDARFEAMLLEQEGCDTSCRETASPQTPDPFS